MNKSDLKDGMLVRLRNGDVRVIWNNDLYEIYAEKLASCNSLSNYTDDLKHIYNDSYKELDIMWVGYDSELLWEREKEVDWSKVLVGTKVLVSDNERNWYEQLFVDYRHDKEYKFKALGMKYKDFHNWRYCKLAEELQEEVIIEELTSKYKSFEEELCREYEECEECKYYRCEDCKFAWLLDNYNVTRKEEKE